MRLDSLILKNYRCFEEISIDFHPQLTVLIAPNGAGKTTILDAARVALWPFVKGFDLGSQTGKAASIQIADVRLALQASGNMEPQTPCEIKATGRWSETQPGKVWMQFRERMKTGTNTIGDASSRKMTAYGKFLERDVRDGQMSITLPLITYLGTSRLWYQGRFTSSAEETTLSINEYSRTSGYLNCLAYASSFRAFTVWYGWVYRSYREAQLIALERNSQLSQEGQRLISIIQVVKSAVDALVKGQTGWHSLEYSASHQQQLIMRHERLGIMPVEMLSDGLRNTIAMVADIAFRAYKLNPHLGVNAAQQTSGVALIDEVDMFLHPAWQQTILGSLTTAFPKLQFIVTTHSPQVLSTVKRENIRIIGPDTNGKIIVAPPLGMTYGEPSGDVLHSVMMVDPQPPVQEKADLRRLTTLVDQGAYESAQAIELRQALLAALGEQHPQLQRLERSIARQNMLRKMSNS